MRIRSRRGTKARCVDLLRREQRAGLLDDGVEQHVLLPQQSSSSSSSSSSSFRKSKNGARWVVVVVGWGRSIRPHRRGDRPRSGARRRGARDTKERDGARRPPPSRRRAAGRPPAAKARTKGIPPPPPPQRVRSARAQRGRRRLGARGIPGGGVHIVILSFSVVIKKRRFFLFFH